MKKLLFFLPLTASGVGIRWNPDPNAQGFKIYYRNVGHERQCDDGKLPKKFVDVGDVTQYVLDPKLFKPNHVYEIRASAYTTGYETRLSEERVCIRIDPKEKGFIGFTLPTKRGFDGTATQAPAETPKENTPENGPIEAPPAPTGPIQQEPIEIEEIDLSDVELSPADADRDDGWDRDLDVGSYGSGREWGEPEPERVQPLLGSEGTSRVEQGGHGSSPPHQPNSGPQRFDLLKETYAGRLRPGQRILLRGDGLHDKRHDAAGIRSEQTSLRRNQNRFAQTAYWAAAAIALVFLGVFFIPWPHEKGNNGTSV